MGPRCREAGLARKRQAADLHQNGCGNQVAQQGKGTKAARMNEG